MTQAAFFDDREELSALMEQPRAMTFEQLYREHFDFVWRTLSRLGVREPDLADCAQEVFVIAYRKLPDFEGRAKPTTWLFSIAFRVVSARRNKASTRREFAAPEETFERPADGADPHTLFERRQDIERLEAALDSLSLEQRTVLVMFEFEELSGDAIAAALEIPLPTVHSRLRLARLAFRKALARSEAQDRALELRRGVAT